MIWKEYLRLIKSMALMKQKYLEYLLIYIDYFSWDRNAMLEYFEASYD